MQARIDRMYRGDCALIITFLVLFWAVLIRVMVVVVGLAGTPALKVASLAAGLVAALAATAGMLAVIGHLRRHKIPLYTEDIASSRLARDASDLHGEQV